MINRWKITNDDFDGYLTDECYVFYHSHVSAMFANVPEIYRLCFDVNRWSIPEESRLKGSESLHVTSDHEASLWIASFLLETIFLWSLFLFPDDLISFGECMFKSLKMGEVVRNGHMLTRMCDFKSFGELYADPGMRARGYDSELIRLKSKKYLQRVLNPSLYDARPEAIKELVLNDEYSKASSTMGPQNLIDPVKKVKNIGLGVDGVSIELGSGENIDLSDNESMMRFCASFAGAQEQANMLMSGFDKLSKRFYRTQQTICSAENGTFLREALGGMLLD